MPSKSKFRGYDLLGDEEPFKIGDFYYPAPYYMIDGKAFSLLGWGKVTRDNGPTREGETFMQRHRVTNYTVIRKSATYEGFSRRLALNRAFSNPLPLP